MRRNATCLGATQICVTSPSTTSRAPASIPPWCTTGISRGSSSSISTAWPSVGFFSVADGCLSALGLSGSCRPPAHGTFLGHIRLEPHKPQQVPIDSTMSFGASTRLYTLREKPQAQPSAAAGESKAGEDEELRGLLGLPEEETELENLTEFNTAHNKRISTLTIEEGNLDLPRPKRKRRSSRVTFSEEEEIINPEDVDPSVGRFRNMIQTAVVPLKRKRSDGRGGLGLEEAMARRTYNFPLSGGLYGDLPPTSNETGHHLAAAQSGSTILGGLPLPFPNPAPEVDLAPAAAQPPVTLNPTPAPGPYVAELHNEPRKKKYAKEAWPGKKPAPSLLI
nr:nuclear inhibitor of protein phosphatase 1-like isoform X5 [Paramormyrops kingsleyae]XP_023659517.1 nuclear inhibitor of protein phosphatase 1-like isoform X5 [Paramormyrops kingsleyae]